MSLPKGRVVVTVGTDHHRFERLVDWIEGLVPEVVAGKEILVQHGATRASTLTENLEYIPRSELLQRMHAADVVVGHGGPGTIMDARSAGKLPIIVPRLARLGEVVDDHQVAFTRRMAARGLIVAAEDATSFRMAVEAGLSDPARFSNAKVGASDGAVAVVEEFRRITSQRTRPRRSDVFRRLRSLRKRADM